MATRQSRMSFQPDWVTLYVDSDCPMLPDYRPIVREEPMLGRAPVKRYGSVFPEIITLPDGRKVIDWFIRRDRVVAIVHDGKDHPNIAKLPVHAPNAVRELYRGHQQIALYRRTHYPTPLELGAAAAWMRFHGYRRTG